MSISFVVAMQKENPYDLIQEMSSFHKIKKTQPWLCEEEVEKLNPEREDSEVRPGKHNCVCVCAAVKHCKHLI
jgi:hypothetical protein